ncbi:hypothetical protein [Baaleninema sp.]|uniref:hypothetical protein n=1 Tax=Baaleninema sp. TaxID=3101197 RepID=UPI003D03F6B4
MKRPSQLVRLLWDFYREDLTELKQLKILQHCNVFRFWGILYIRCQTPSTAELVMAAEPLIQIPVQELRLSKKIRVLIGRKAIATFEVVGNRSNSEIHERL